MVIIKVVYLFYRFQDGQWAGPPPWTSLLNEYHKTHADPFHPDPDRQAINLARKLNPEIEVHHRDRPGKPYKDPYDQAPHWLQCLFDPGVTFLPVSSFLRSLSGPKKNA